MAWKVAKVNSETNRFGPSIEAAMGISTAQAAAIAAAAASGPVSSVSGKTGAVTLTKTDAGLSAVNNTSDLEKPLSTAVIDALGTKAPLSHNHPITALQTTGTPSAATALFGDGAWKVPSGGGSGSSQSTIASKTADFTVSDDGIDVYEVNSSTAVTVTLPSTIPTGTNKEFCQVGTGKVTLVNGAGALLDIPFSEGASTKERWSSVWARSRQTSIVTDPPATNMLLRFRADDLTGAGGSAVSSWPEISGNGHPAAVQANSANQPTLQTNSGGTGRKGVSFNGSSSFLTLSGSALNIARNKAGLCIFAAIAFTSAVSTGTRTFFSLSSGTGATSSRVLFGHRDSVSGFPILGGRRLDANSLSSVLGAAAINTVQNTVLSGRMVFANSDLYIYKDGTLANSNTSFQTDGSTSDTASLAGVIGANLAGTGEWFQGHLLELCVYDGDDPTGSLRQNVHSYYAQRYGIAVADALPATTEWILAGGTA